MYDCISRKEARWTLLWSVDRAKVIFFDCLLGLVRPTPTNPQEIMEEFERLWQRALESHMRKCTK